MTPYAIKPLIGKSATDGDVRVLSLSLAAPYCAASTLDFYDRADVDVFIADLKAEAEKLWPGMLV